MHMVNIIISAAITYILIIFSINNIVNQKINFKMFLKYLILMLIFGVIICAYFDGISRILLNIFFVGFSLYISIFNRDMSKSIYFAIIYEILAIIVEIFLSVLLVTLIKLDLNSYESFSYSLLLFTICNSVLVYFITKIKFVSSSILKIYDKISNKFKDWIYILIVINLMILLATFNKFNLSLSLEFFINVFFFVFVILSLVYVAYNKIQKEGYEKKYNESMEYVQKYEKIINEQGKKNHEYNNQLMVIMGYKNNPKKLEEYLNLIVEEYKCGQNYTIRQLSYFPDGGIKGLIYHKISKMDDNNIKYYLYVDQNIKNIFEEKFNVKTYQDITKILGVFLDNAIEATLETIDREVEIDIKNEDNVITITISNTFNSENNIKQIGKRGFTTKGIGHGYGLSIVKDITKHNNKIETVCDIENNKFIQTIIIYY